MKKSLVFVVANEGFRDEELLEPKKVLEKRGVQVTVAAARRDAALGKLGTTLTPDLVLSEVRADQYDGIVFIGGPGAQVYFADDQALKILQTFQKAGKIIAGICSATSVLANAGVLIGRVATGFPTEESNIRDKGAEYTGMPVEVDGKVITAKEPAAAKAFGEALANALGV